MINTSLDDICAEIGFTATLTLVAWFGDGKNSLYVPAAVDDHQKIAKLIGEAAARRLSARWPQELLSIPALSGYDQQVLRRCVARLLQGGVSTTDVADRIGLTERRVQQICRELEVDGLIEIVLPRNKGGRRRKDTEEIAPGKLTGKGPMKSGGKKEAVDHSVIDGVMRQFGGKRKDTAHR